MVIRLKVPIEMHYTVIPMGTSKVNSSRHCYYSYFTITALIVVAHAVVSDKLID